MLIHLSNDMYINPDKITAISKRVRENTDPKYDRHGKVIMQPIVTTVDWLIVFDAENRLTLSQAHFDELMAAMPKAVDGAECLKLVTELKGIYSESQLEYEQRVRSK